MSGKYTWLKDRGAGLSLHLSCLPGTQGIGVLGRHAHKLIEFCAAAGLRYWQLLPTGPTGFGDSPFQTLSAFAGNPLFIDMEVLPQLGLLHPGELSPLNRLPAQRVDYGRLYAVKMPLLRLAWRRFRERDLSYLPNYGLLHLFTSEHKDWLEAYSLFMALKQAFQQKPWYDWPQEYRNYPSASEAGLTLNMLEEQEFHSWLQYLLFGQFRLLRQKAAHVGVHIVGMVPHHLPMDCADVWQHPSLFGVDGEAQPKFWVGEVPSASLPFGSIRHQPAYDWDNGGQELLSWWRSRLHHGLQIHDVQILDNFRMFSQVWQVPAASDSAAHGAWHKVPGATLFDFLSNHASPLRLLAKDVEWESSQNRTLANSLGLAGCVLVQNGFQSKGRSPHAPHFMEFNSVICTTDHDSSTIQSWYDTSEPWIQDKVRRYLRVNGNDIAWDLIRCAYRSNSALAVIAFQDVLALDNSARLNVPGVVGGNWSWRIQQDEWNSLVNTHGYLAELGWLYDR
ncbi:MAG: 4-alpha-glucanotransferase [Verrucomicrobia bacterium]|nr:4-alpha-glucanotransferase [Verrucomicrobiota bacterium]